VWFTEPGADKIGEISALVAVEGSAEAAPHFRVSPNPARGRLNFAFTLAVAGRARLEILDVTGRHVGTLVDRVLPAGRHEATWMPEQGNHGAAAGLYLASLEVGAARAMRRFVVVR
jgi:hypothetical protein